LGSYNQSLYSQKKALSETFNFILVSIYIYIGHIWQHESDNAICFIYTRLIPFLYSDTNAEW